MPPSPICRTCYDPLTDDNWSPSYKRINRRDCKKCESIRNLQWRTNNRKQYIEILSRWRRSKGILPANKNRMCSKFLGEHVAERLLCRMFNDVDRAPPNTPGYDFACSNGYLIDSKASCIHIRDNKSPHWHFNIRRNTIADYFVLLAFDNRNYINPLYVWMIPGHVVNHLMTAGISESTIDKWKDYALDITKVVSCCDTMRGATQ